MKIKELTMLFFRSNSILKLLLFMAAFLNVPSLKSQEGSLVKFYPSFGISAGFFNPKQVNDFIKHDLSSNNIIASGTTDIFVYYELHGGLTLKIKWLDINGFLEYATAPKWVIVTNGSSRTYFFNRITYGATANFHIPLGSRKNSFFLGGGIHYNNLKFDDYSASAPGFRVQAGVSLQFGRFNLQPYVGYNNVIATDKSTPGGFELNYTSGQIGILFSFHR